MALMEINRHMRDDERRSMPRATRIERQTCVAWTRAQHALFRSLAIAYARVAHNLPTIL